MHCAPHKYTLPLLLQSCRSAGAGRLPCAGRHTAVVPASKRALERAGAYELERAGALAPDAIVAHRFVHIQSQGMAMDHPVHLPCF